MKYCIPLISIVIALLIGACNSPELLGVELLDDESIVIQFTDVIRPTVSTVEDDSIIIFATSGFNLRNSEQWPLGQFDDPTFGSARSIVYLTPGIGTGNLPDFVDASFDSLVLILPLDTLASYGDPFTSYEINVHRLDEFPSSSTVIADRIDTIYTDQEFAFDPDPIGTTSVVPMYNDSLEVFSPILDTLGAVRPQIRIRLNESIGMEFLDTMSVTSDSTFQGIARGFAITAEGDQNGFIGLNFDNFTSSSTNAQMAMYYTDTAGVAQLYNFSLGIFKSATYFHDYDGSEVAAALAGDNTRSYVQGLGGVNTRIDLSDVMQFADQGINYAELEITVDESIVTDAEPAVTDFLALYTEEGFNFLVEDADPNVDATIYALIFDGSLQTVSRNGQDVLVYKIILTNHVINLLEGSITTPFIELIPTGKIETPFRTALFGNTGDENEIKLNLVVTTP